MESDRTTPTLGEVSGRMREDLQKLREAIEQQTSQPRSNLVGLANQRPFATVAAALGVGFILSGGLFSRTTARAIAFGGRWLLSALVRQAVAAEGMSFLSPWLEKMDQAE